MTVIPGAFPRTIGFLIAVFAALPSSAQGAARDLRREGYRRLRASEASRSAAPSGLRLALLSGARSAQDPSTERESTASSGQSEEYSWSAGYSKGAAATAAAAAATSTAAAAAGGHAESVSHQRTADASVPCVKAQWLSGGSSSCVPTCTWQCESPKCEEVCEPRCQAPRCETRCKAPDTSSCKINCNKPQCIVSCPKGRCPKGDCDMCETQCGHPTCLLNCGEQDCSYVCEHPKCDWHCHEPKMCPKPLCRMVCEAPPSCKGDTTYHDELPPKAPGYTTVSGFRGVVAPLSLLSNVSSHSLFSKSVRGVPCKVPSSALVPVARHARGATQVPKAAVAVQVPTAEEMQMIGDAASTQ